MYLLVIFFPLISATIILLFGRFLGTKGANLFSCFCLGLNVVISCFIYYDIIVCNSIIIINLWNWVSFNVFETNITFFIDSLSGGMIFVVNLVSFLVHVYSTSYMKGDPHTPRFMGYLSLFTFFMLILVTSQNYLQLFIGWEGVGLSSYLLINYWFGRIQANKAAIKAMLVNRVGDAALIAAIILIWINYGNVNFFTTFSSHNDIIDTMIPILLLIGAVGKSAQIGLHTWLPDAMEGPTPVSALIHAATMVTAGVYLIIRSSSLFEVSPTSLIITVLVGGITALFAATVGLAQNDIKKIIAYSTCSQLGFMVLACGISYYSLSLFHLINHAFFKALLFLSAGSVIHALSDEQDIRKMGGTSIILPLSYIFILIGSLSLAGTPFLAGYYSKDLLLELSTKQYYVIIGAWLGLAATLLTAFYSFKLISRTFIMYQNSPRVYWKSAHEGEFNLLWPLFILSLGSLFSGFYMKDLILGPIIHPNILMVIKFTPLILSIIGASIALTLFVLSKKYWLLFINKIVKKLYGFLSSAWGFDKIISTFIVKPIWSFGYNVSFKLFDSGFIEMFGPFGVSKKIIIATQRISSIQSGFLFNYALFILMGASIYVMLN
uniref:NADH-ubiquinone oxidoreductase chain 5 n=1 Tax=Cyanea capillata TaxID=27804 RepID=G9ISG6_CYACP|nr:NADH dehydrogenase subunit 5 [Cyanea capillata]